MGTSTDIDNAIADRYQGFSGNGELAQLERLFDASFVSALHTILASTPHTLSLKIRLDWIDKRPYADMAISKAKDINDHLITRPVELGDAAIFVIEAFSLNGQIVSKKGRGLILQAKVAPGPAMANVPVTSLSGSNPDASTNKELALLSQWPGFELHLANNRRGKSLGIYSIPMLSTPPPYGWYAAAPGPDSIGWSSNGQWRSRWMCAPAVNGCACDSTLGEVIEALFHRQKITGAFVGADCYPVAGTYKAIYRNPPQKGPTDWDMLCTTLLELPVKKHRVSSGAHGVFASFPYLPQLIGMAGLRGIYRWWLSRFRRDRFPILIIERVRQD
ncbi:hypothetical protein P5705_17775 [Pseudomonas entomophila]|uniref:hypothetical protein n=1 Tax=Pseudomonas entomophila TaxID=312306 RepID=UPI00240688F3|nr:hypothetical protein [Pseudomonas entomophila]MDF9619499.1 hypothetical protein [Pseudomonas entomophila]